MEPYVAFSCLLTLLSSFKSNKNPKIATPKNTVVKVHPVCICDNNSSPNQYTITVIDNSFTTLNKNTKKPIMLKIINCLKNRECHNGHFLQWLPIHYGPLQYTPIFSMVVYLSLFINYFSIVFNSNTIGIYIKVSIRS